MGAKMDSIVLEEKRKGTINNEHKVRDSVTLSEGGETHAGP
jgi:hypothetical protein